MLVFFLTLIAWLPPQPVTIPIVPASEPDCYRLSWLNLQSAELGHGFCREGASKLEHLLAVTRSSTMAVYWIEKVDCQKVRGGNGCEWETSTDTLPTHRR